MSLSWYVINSKPNKEKFLFSQLLHREIETFYPRLRVEPVNPRSRKIKPYFPGYLFVHVDLDKTPISSLTYIPGAKRVVSFDYEPAIVPDDVISVIQDNVERMNRDPKKYQIALKHGDPVVIKGGPFEGYQAIFDADLKGSDRVRLLIKLLHAQQIRVQVPKDMVKPKKS
ncbi:MAG: transcription termination/antitermination NusG family protein [Chloroflexota bacterium]|nr:transcription termination/antitermination NusG family protein [Chloroflexota bacterium]